MSNFIEAYSKNLKKARADVEEIILGGRCQDYASYKAKLGERAGLIEAERQITSTLKQLGEEDD